MTTIAVIGMGEMGSAMAGSLIEHGARVVTSLEGRTVQSLQRARAVGAEAVGELEMIEQAELVLSIVPPAAAARVAQRVLPLIQRSSGRPTFLDCNAVAPQTLLAISRPFVDLQLRFGDASIIGPRPITGGASPRLYMSGAIGESAGLLGALGIDARVLSGVLGDASALKMAYAGITKGFQALGTAMALGAARNGAAESLIHELRDSQPALYGWLARMLPGMYAKAHRWDDEMREIAKFLEPEHGSVGLFTGAADLYRHVAASHREGPQSEVIATLDRFSNPQS